MASTECWNESPPVRGTRQTDSARLCSSNDRPPSKGLLPITHYGERSNSEYSEYRERGKEIKGRGLHRFHPSLSFDAPDLKVSHRPICGHNIVASASSRDLSWMRAKAKLTLRTTPQSVSYTFPNRTIHSS